jgi:hypothetical protein
MKRGEGGKLRVKKTRDIIRNFIKKSIGCFYNIH